MPTGLFSNQDVIRRVDGELALLAGGGRALLLQLAHPLVARGVAEHSGFDADPFARLQRTLDASYAIVFGTEDEAARSAAVIRAVHDRVVGDGYAANDPALLEWVHATLVDTALFVHGRLLGTLSPAEAEEYYQQSAEVAALLGVPRDQQPADLAAFRSYMAHMVATVRVSGEARELSRRILHPPGPLALVFPAVRQLTVGWLPRPIREGYGLRWDARRKAALLAAETAARQVLPRLPSAIRRAPLPIRFAA